ncbi:hypothetical protein DB31_2388 [Hyalangium minutum]|uniref:Uncharacterized protein n=1 Tax=Hyalangium minutum TaxID=394096 RepID=A0A085W8G3_9BACT|nr:hypothetical protein DB31_2388 [Hyalangium minutum]
MNIRGAASKCDLKNLVEFHGQARMLAPPQRRAKIPPRHKRQRRRLPEGNPRRGLLH